MERAEDTETTTASRKMQRNTRSAAQRNVKIDAETVLRHAQAPIDPAELAGILDVPHAALGRVLRRLVETEQLRWVWNDARTSSLCLDARIACPEGYTEGVQGARLRDKGGPAPKSSAKRPALDPATPAQRAANDIAPPPAHSAQEAAQRAAADTPDGDPAPTDPEGVLRQVVRRAGSVRRPALARSGAARTGLSRSQTDTLIDRLIASGDLVEIREGNAHWLTAPSTTQNTSAEAGASTGAYPDRTAPVARDDNAQGATPIQAQPWMIGVLRVLQDLGDARRDQIETIARSPGVGGASANITSATAALEASRFIAPTASGGWQTTAVGAQQLAAAEARALPGTRLATVRDQPDLQTPVHEHVLAAHGRTSGAVKLRDIADRTGVDVRALLRAAANLEAVDALEMSRDKRSPARVTIRAAWRNAVLCGPEHDPGGASDAGLDATTARALLALTALGYTTAADLDAPNVRRRWDVAGHGANPALQQLRTLGLAHGPDRMGRWFPTDAGADAESEVARVLGRFRPESLERRV
jgi:hypothetical protein